MPLVKFLPEERKQSPSLQAFVESIYTNAVAVLEDGKSMYQQVDFQFMYLTVNRIRFHSSNQKI